MVAKAVAQTRSSTPPCNDAVEALADLGRAFFDEALVSCDDEGEAAFVASAKLLGLLEREQLVFTPSLQSGAA